MSRRILMIDDDISLAEMVREFLEPHDIKASRSHRGPKGRGPRSPFPMPEPPGPEPMDSKGPDGNQDEDRPPPYLPKFLDFFYKEPPRYALVIDQDGFRYGFFPPDMRSFAWRYQRYLFPFLLIMTFLIASSYFAIRNVLLPMNALLRGVRAVSGGDLTTRVKVGGGDEFEQLANAFNHMVEQIRETMEAKERLLLDVSHELQSPLARMKLAVELMQEEKAKERLRVNLKDIETMVAEILESARLDSSPGSLHWQNLNLTKTIEDFMQVYEAMGLPVTFEGGAASTLLEFDPARINVVLRNLVDNALKHADAQNKRVQVRIILEAERVRVEVEDNGQGIPAEEIPRLFAPFYRVDKSRDRQTGGYGLGLSLCQRIIEAHAGEIKLESSPGRTVASFTLPRQRPGP